MPSGKTLYRDVVSVLIGLKDYIVPDHWSTSKVVLQLLAGLYARTKESF